MILALLVIHQPLLQQLLSLFHCLMTVTGCTSTVATHTPAAPYQQQHTTDIVERRQTIFLCTSTKKCQDSQESLSHWTSCITLLKETLMLFFFKKSRCEISRDLLFPKLYRWYWRDVHGSKPVPKAGSTKGPRAPPALGVSTLIRDCHHTSSSPRTLSVRRSSPRSVFCLGVVHWLVHIFGIGS